MDFKKGDRQEWTVGGRKKGGWRRWNWKRERAAHTHIHTDQWVVCIYFFSPTALIMALQLLICHLSDYCKAFHSVERIPLQSPNSPLEIKTNCHRYLFKSPLSQLYMCAGCRFPHKVWNLWKQSMLDLDLYRDPHQIILSSIQTCQIFSSHFRHYSLKITQNTEKTLQDPSFYPDPHQKLMGCILDWDPSSIQLSWKIHSAVFV